MTELVAREVVVGGRALDLLVPADSEALLDEEAFEHDEFLPYWAELWPSGSALAEAVAEATPSGPVLELGCGLGLPALAAALGGARTLATDWSQDAVELLERNARRVGAALDAQRWAWTDDPAALGGPFALVLAADVLYERRNGPQLLAALPRLVAPGGEVWLADPGRAAAEGFLTAAAQRWRIEEHGRSGRVTIRRLRASG